MFKLIPGIFGHAKIMLRYFRTSNIISNMIGCNFMYRLFNIHLTYNQCHHLSLPAWVFTCALPHQHWITCCVFIAWGWVLISLQGEYWKIFALGTGLENLGSRDRIGQYCSASRDGHQIHPRRVTRIDSVEINPSLVMMREWLTLWRTSLL